MWKVGKMVVVEKFGDWLFGVDVELWGDDELQRTLPRCNPQGDESSGCLQLDRWPERGAAAGNE